MNATAATNHDTPDLQWDAFANTQSGANPANASPPDFGYDVLEKQYEALRTLCTPDEGETMPTNEALHRACEVIEGTSLVMSCHREGTGDPVWDYPLCFLSTDDNGSVRMEWWHGKSHCISLDTGHSERTPLTVFAKFGAADPGRMFPHPYPNWLAAQLVRLNKAGQQG